MEIKRCKEVISLAVVLAVASTGFLLVYWFYTIISQEEHRVSDSQKVIEIRDDILDKVTTQSSSEPLRLEDDDFGRENPFGDIK